MVHHSASTDAMNDGGIGNHEKPGRDIASVVLAKLALRAKGCTYL